MYDIKVYNSDGQECETIRNLRIAQVTALQAVFYRLNVKIKIIAVLTSSLEEE